jgi:hypothetical protein
VPPLAFALSHKKESAVFRTRVILLAACGCLLASRAPAQVQVPLNGGTPIQPVLPSFPVLPGLVGDSNLFLFPTRVGAARRLQTAQLRNDIARLRLNQMQQQEPQDTPEDLIQRLEDAKTLVGRRAATFDDTRGAFPQVQLPRRSTLGARGRKSSRSRGRGPTPPPPKPMKGATR